MSAEAEHVPDEMVDFFKTLVDAERLKVVGVLALESRTAGQVADALHLPAAAVARHLERLAGTGLVKVVNDRYLLDTSHLEALARRVLAGRQPRLTADDFEGEPGERKILSDYSLPDGRLKTIPAQFEKRLVVLRYLAGTFEPGVRYSEKQVNEMLRRFHEDTASLRRYLVDEGLLARQGGQYWRVEGNRGIGEP